MLNAVFVNVKLAFGQIVNAVAKAVRNTYGHYDHVGVNTKYVVICLSVSGAGSQHCQATKISLSHLFVIAEECCSQLPRRPRCVGGVTSRP